MNEMQLIKTNLDGVYRIKAFYSEDNRGFFLKDYDKNFYINNGLESNIHECFESTSYKNVVRGIHFQLYNPQAKLVRVVNGSIFDVVVDLRPNSPTLGKWEGFYLSSEEADSIYVPKGFGHGFAVSSNIATVSYKCFGEYIKEYDSGIVWNDKVLGINWAIENPVISKRDAALMTFSEYYALSNTMY